MPTPPTYSADQLKSQQDFLKEKEKELRLAKEILALNKSNNTTTTRMYADVRDKAQLVEDERDNLTTIVDMRKEESALLAEQFQSTQDIRDSYDALGNSIQNNLLKNEAAKQIELDRIGYIKEQLQLNKISNDDARDQIGAAKELVKKIDKQSAGMKKVQDRFEQSTIWSSKLGKNVEDIIAAFRGGPAAGFTLLAHKGLQSIHAILLKGLKMGLNAVWGQMKKLLFTMDEVTKGFEVATGMGDKFNDSMVQSWYDTNQLGVTMEDLSKATQSLIANTSDFSLAQIDVANRVRDTGVLLNKLGIEVDDYSTGIQNSMKMFGQSFTGAEATARELEATARELRVTPKQLSADYAKMGGSLAKLGLRGPQVFKELARVSKLTGLEMQKIVNLTDKFDTFESAAEMTGKLNAALGGNFVNAMDMMMDTDPVSRFEQLRDAISSTGLTFDYMSYYQAQFFTKAMGLSDVGDLALMMRGNMDMISGSTKKSAKSYVELARQAEENMNLQQRWQALLAEMAPMLMDIVEELHEFMKSIMANKAELESIAEGFRKFMQFGMWVMKNMGTVVAVLGTLRLALAAVMYQAGGAALALSGPVGLIAAVGALGFSIWHMSASDPLMKTLREGLPNALSKVTGKVGETTTALSNSGGSLKDFAHNAYESADKLGVAADGMAKVQRSAAKIGTATGTGFFEAINNVDAAMLEKVRQLFEGIADAMKDIPEKKAIAMTTTMNQAVVTAEAARNLQFGPARGQEGAGRGGIFSGKKEKTSGNELLGTIKLEFNEPYLKNQMIEISKDQADKRVKAALANET